ncbi:MAG TPA: M20/M25/M40 family metallo-hydrolase [Ktedonobacteraceae bacterium]|nr:M20/M25/M40 family metallo-hydrolase [Ktedonobacteraceae bacterium]
MVSSQQIRLLELMRPTLSFVVKTLDQEYRRVYSASQDSKKSLLARLQESGFALQADRSTDSLLYLELPGKSDRSLFLYSHHPALFQADGPALMAVSGSVGERFYAPGIAGAMGTTLAWLMGIEAFRQQFGTLPVTIKWLFDGDSSTDSTHLEAFLAQSGQGSGADFCLCSGESFAVDGSPRIALGVKGRLGVSLKARSAIREIELQHGTIVPNALWRLTWALASLKDQQEEVQLAGFYDTLLLSGETELEMLYELADDADAQAEHFGLNELLLGLRGFQQHYAQYLLPTCTVASLEGIASGDGIPAYAEATLDFHLVPGQQPELVFQQLRQHLLERGLGEIEVNWLYGLSPAYTPVDTPLLQRIVYVLALASLKKLQLLPLSSGSLPIKPLIDLLDCPFVCMGMDYPGSQRGTALEHLRLQDFETTILQLVLLLDMFEEDSIGPDGTHSIERSDLGDSGVS